MWMQAITSFVKSDTPFHETQLHEEFYRKTR